MSTAKENRFYSKIKDINQARIHLKDISLPVSIDEMVEELVRRPRQLNHFLIAVLKNTINENHKKSLFMTQQRKNKYEESALVKYVITMIEEKLNTKREKRS